MHPLCVFSNDWEFLESNKYARQRAFIVMGQSYVVGDTGQNFVLFSDRVTSRQGVPKWQFSLLDGMVVPLYDHP